MLYEDNDNTRLLFIAAGTAGPAPKAAKQATASPGSWSIQELPPEWWAGCWFRKWEIFTTDCSIQEYKNPTSAPGRALLSEQDRQRTVLSAAALLWKVTTGRADGGLQGIGGQHQQLHVGGWCLILLPHREVYLSVLCCRHAYYYSAVESILHWQLAHIYCRCSEQLLSSCSDGSFLECSPPTVEA